MTKAEREEQARLFTCPRCKSVPGMACRSHIPQYTPMGYFSERYGRKMIHVHPERLALVPEPTPGPAR